MKNPLDADPECAQFAKLMLRQSAEDSFGFNRQQVRKLTSTERGKLMWDSLMKSYRGKKFDFSMFCRELCDPEFNTVRRCFRQAHDPREVCFREVWDLCKKVEHVWTDISFRTV
jgi:hypothetical protein